MGAYVLIGSDDPFASTSGRRLYELAHQLADHGDDVSVYLVHNGVLPCRSGSSLAGDVRSLASATSVLADDFSLRERAITSTDVVEGVQVASIDALVDAVMDEGRKVLWF